MESRKDLEKHFDKKVFLDLQVKVDANWVEDARLIAEYASLDILS
jgi:GTPase Era involved in 16S rRNA processing